MPAPATARPHLAALCCHPRFSTPPNHRQEETTTRNNSARPSPPSTSLNSLEALGLPAPLPAPDGSAGGRDGGEQGPAPRTQQRASLTFPPTPDALRGRTEPSDPSCPKIKICTTQSYSPLPPAPPATKLMHRERYSSSRRKGDAGWTGLGVLRIDFQGEEVGGKGGGGEQPERARVSPSAQPNINKQPSPNSPAAPSTSSIHPREGGAKQTGL